MTAYLKYSTQYHQHKLHSAVILTSIRPEVQGGVPYCLHVGIVGSSVQHNVSVLAYGTCTSSNASHHWRDSFKYNRIANEAASDALPQHQVVPKPYQQHSPVLWHTLQSRSILAILLMGKDLPMHYSLIELRIPGCTLSHYTFATAPRSLLPARLRSTFQIAVVTVPAAHQHSLFQRQASNVLSLSDFTS